MRSKKRGGRGIPDATATGGGKRAGETVNLREKASKGTVVSECSKNDLCSNRGITPLFKWVGGGHSLLESRK